MERTKKKIKLTIGYIVDTYFFSDANMDTILEDLRQYGGAEIIDMEIVEENIPLT